MKVERAKFALQQLDGEEGFLRICLHTATKMAKEKLLLRVSAAPPIAIVQNVEHDDGDDDFGDFAALSDFDGEKRKRPRFRGSGCCKPQPRSLDHFRVQQTADAILCILCRS